MAQRKLEKNEEIKKTQVRDFQKEIRRYITPVVISLIFLWSLFLFLPIFLQSYPSRTVSVPLLPLIFRVLEVYLPSYKLIFYQTFTSLFFLLSSVSLFFWVYFLTKRYFPAMVAVLFYNLPTPLVGSPVPSRLIALSEGEIAHLVGLSLTPFALFFFLRYLKKDSFAQAINLSFFVTLIGLISRVSLFALTIFYIIIFFSETLLGELGERKTKLFRAILLLIMVICLLVFWYNFHHLYLTWNYFRQVGSLSLLWDLVPVSFTIVPSVWVVIYLACDRKPQYQPMLISFLSAVGFAALCFLPQFLGKTFVPGAERFVLEFDLVFSTLFALLATRLFDFILDKEPYLFAWWKLTPKYLGILTLTYVILLFSFLGGVNFYLRGRIENFLAQLPETERFSSFVLQEVTLRGSGSEILGCFISFSTLVFLLNLRFIQHEINEKIRSKINKVISPAIQRISH